MVPLPLERTMNVDLRGRTVLDPEIFKPETQNMLLVEKVPTRSLLSPVARGLQVEYGDRGATLSTSKAAVSSHSSPVLELGWGEPCSQHGLCFGIPHIVKHFGLCRASQAPCKLCFAGLKFTTNFTGQFTTEILQSAKPDHAFKFQLHKLRSQTAQRQPSAPALA